MTSAILTKAVCIGLAGAEGKQVLSFTADFAEIWGWLSVRAAPSHRDVFIIWDGVPADRGRQQSGIRNFLTVFDWAAAATLLADRARKQGKHDQTPDFRVHVLRACPPDALPKSFSATAGQLLTPLFPWLITYGLERESVARFVAALRAPCASAQDECRDASGPTLRQFSCTQDVEHSAKLIRRLWTAELTRAKIRHSVANFIGPAALAMRMKEAGFDVGTVLDTRADRGEDLRRPFSRLLEVLGLLPPANRTEGRVTQPLLAGLGEDPFVKQDIFGRFHSGGVRFALVDDQAGQGFHSLLSGCLLGAPGPEKTAETEGQELRPSSSSVSRDGQLTLASFEKPSVLLGWLERTASGRAKRWFEPRIFGKSSAVHHADADATQIEEFDILFLDLRLHGIDSTSEQTDAEADWCRSLLQFHDRHIDDIRDRVSGVPQEKVKALATAAEAARHYLDDPDADDGRVLYVALLPLLISVCDPTMPIILFSSTQSRALIDLFRPFPNIVTSFSKPAITGYSREDHLAVRLAGDRLRFSVKMALQLHERRFVWEILSGFSFCNAIAPPFRADPLTRRHGQRVNLPEIWANTPGGQCVDFKKTIWYQKRFYDIFLSYTLNPTKIEDFYRPYEFVESSLGSEFRQSPGDEVSLHFSPKGEQKHRIESYKNLKDARNSVVHGQLTQDGIDYDIVSYTYGILLLEFIEAVGDEGLLSRVAKFRKSASNIVQAVGGKPIPVAATELTMGMTDLLRKLWSNKRILAIHRAVKGRWLDRHV